MAQLLDRVIGAGVEEAADDGFYLCDGLRPVQDRLVGGDVVVGGAHLADVQRAQAHRAELLDLAVARQDPGAVGAQLAVLDDDAELQREPEDARQEAQALDVAQALRRGARAAVQSPNVGVASRCPWPTTSWMMSGSGVYSGSAGWRTYCVE